MLLASLALAVGTAANRTNMTTWHVVWTGGQSNSVGTNSQHPGSYPAWPTTDRIQMFCWSGRGCTQNSFAPAAVPLYGESNVGFSQTFANLLLPTLRMALARLSRAKQQPFLRTLPGTATVRRKTVLARRSQRRTAACLPASPPAPAATTRAT